MLFPSPQQLCELRYIDQNKQTNRLQVISLVKMSLFGISRELQFGVYSQVKLHASPHRARKGELFHRQEKEVGKAGVNQESTAFHWLSCCQDRRGVFPGLCLLSQDMRAPPSGFLTISLQFVFFCMFFFFFFFSPLD